MPNRECALAPGFFGIREFGFHSTFGIRISGTDFPPCAAANITHDGNNVASCGKAAYNVLKPGTLTRGGGFV